MGERGRAGAGDKREKSRRKGKMGWENREGRREEKIGRKQARGVGERRGGDKREYSRRKGKMGREKRKVEWREEKTGWERHECTV